MEDDEQDEGGEEGEEGEEGGEEGGEEAKVGEGKRKGAGAQLTLFPSLFALIFYRIRLQDRL
jgi:hypothetical protein